MSTEREPRIGDLLVSWFPQVPCEPFEVDVESVEQGAFVMKLLADYDRFQYENHIKPDYSNVGVLCRYEADAGDGRPGWVDWYDENTLENDPVRWLEARRDATPCE